MADGRISQVSCTEKQNLLFRVLFDGAGCYREYGCASSGTCASVEPVDDDSGVLWSVHWIYLVEEEVSWRWDTKDPAGACRNQRRKAFFDTDMVLV